MNTTEQILKSMIRFISKTITLSSNPKITMFKKSVTNTFFNEYTNFSHGIVRLYCEINDNCLIYNLKNNNEKYGNSTNNNSTNGNSTNGNSTNGNSTNGNSTNGNLTNSDLINKFIICLNSLNDFVDLTLIVDNIIINVTLEYLIMYDRMCEKIIYYDSECKICINPIIFFYDNNVHNYSYLPSIKYKNIVLKINTLNPSMTNTYMECSMLDSEERRRIAIEKNILCSGDLISKDTNMHNVLNNRNSYLCVDVYDIELLESIEILFNNISICIPVNIIKMYNKVKKQIIYDKRYISLCGLTTEINVRFRDSIKINMKNESKSTVYFFNKTCKNSNDHMYMINNNFHTCFDEFVYDVNSNIQSFEIVFDDVRFLKEIIMYYENENGDKKRLASSFNINIDNEIITTINNQYSDIQQHTYHTNYDPEIYLLNYSLTNSCLPCGNTHASLITIEHFIEESYKLIEQSCKSTEQPCKLIEQPCKLIEQPCKLNNYKLYVQVYSFNIFVK